MCIDFTIMCLYFFFSLDSLILKVYTYFFYLRLKHHNDRPDMNNFLPAPVFKVRNMDQMIIIVRKTVYDC